MNNGFMEDKVSARMGLRHLKFLGVAIVFMGAGPVHAVAPHAQPPVTVTAKTGSQAIDLVQAPGTATLVIGTLQARRCGANVWCGRFPRALDPTGTVPGKIDIAFRWYRHRRADLSSAGTLVAVEGGPGYATSGTSDSYLQMFEPFLDDHDLLLADNRGTGNSGAIDCKPLQTGDGPTSETIGQCGRQLGRTAPLFATAYAADDLAALLQALGRTSIDLYGDSYGTWFGQVFAYRHPELLRSLVLDSAYPVRSAGSDAPWYPFFALTVRNEFNSVCARSPACAAYPGDGIGHIEPALNALRSRPFDAAAKDADGQWQHFRADASMLALVMFAGAPAFTIARELDPAARAFVSGDTAPLLRLMAEAKSSSDPRIGRSPRLYSEGLFWAVSCHDYEQVYDMTLSVPARRAQRDLRMAERESRYPYTFAPFTIDEFRGMSLDYSVLDACIDWPVPSTAHPPGPPIPESAAMPDIPVLVLSGELDSITTPNEGAIVAANFPNAKQVVVANRFHLVALPPQRDTCALDIVRRFVKTLDVGDTSCASEVAPLRTPGRFARRASELPIPHVLPGNRADGARLRIAAAVVATLGDALNRAESNSTGRAPGLRGGWVDISNNGPSWGLDLTDARWTEDVRVDGHLHWPFQQGQAVAHVRVKGPDGVQGTLEVTWPSGAAAANAIVKGRLDGSDVVARIAAP